VQRGDDKQIINHGAIFHRFVRNLILFVGHYGISL